MPPIIVAGLGRCGSSLVMQMLHFGGVECVGDYPWFEDATKAKLLPEDTALLDTAGDRAVKLLHPDKYLPKGYHLEARAIWLDRNPREQAKSWTKMQKEIGYTQSRRELGEKTKLMKTRSSDGYRAVRASFGTPLQLRFENILARPEAMAEQIAEHVGRDLNLEAMVACIAPRDSRCFGGFLENKLMGGEINAPLMGV